MDKIQSVLHTNETEIIPILRDGDVHGVKWGKVKAGEFFAFDHKRNEDGDLVYVVAAKILVINDSMLAIDYPPGSDWGPIIAGMIFARHRDRRSQNRFTEDQVLAMLTRDRVKSTAKKSSRRKSR